MNLPLVELTVVIPTYGRESKLLALLDRMEQQSLGRERFHCIVVDDGSPEPVELGDYSFELQLLRCENRGPGGARNEALQHSRGEFTLYLNDDAVPALDLLEKHLDAQRAAPAKTLILGTFDFTPEALKSPFTQILQGTKLLFSYRDLESGQRLPWGYCWTCNLSVPTEALREVGGFDQQLFDYPIVEDVELGYRLQKLGYQVQYAEDCVALHDHSLDITAYVQRAEQLGFYLARMWAKHGEASILRCENDEQVQQLLLQANQESEGRRASVSALNQALENFENQARGQVLDPATIQRFESGIQEVCVGPWMAGIHRAITGVRSDQVASDGAPKDLLTTLVIVSHNALEFTQNCIEGIRRTHDPERPTQIVVVDNGSTDGSAEWLATQTDVELIANSDNRGAPAARNQALARNLGTWVCFLDNDVVVTQGWLERAQYHSAVDPRVGCVCFVAQRASKDQVVPYTGDGSQAQIEAYSQERLRDHYRCGKSTSLFASFGVLVRREVIEKIGGFDETFSPWGFEDDDFALRSLLAGFQNRVAQDVFVYHAPYPDRAKHQRHSDHMHTNWVAFAKKWGPAGAPLPPIFDYKALQLRLDTQPNSCSLHVALPAATPPPVGPIAVQALHHPVATKGAQNVVVIGAGRSGTSMLAGSLANAGWDAGKDPYAGRDSNPKGFYETAEINGLNEYLLAQAYPAAPPAGAMQRWLLALPGRVECKGDHFVSQRLAKAVKTTPFVIKDPRMCYTLDAWRPHFDEQTRFVCIFRDPAITAASTLREVSQADYLSGVTLDTEQALEVWRCMYARVVEQHRHQGTWLFLHYDQLFTETGKARLESFVGAPIQRDFAEPALSRSRSEHPVSEEVAELYAQLCELAEHEPISRPTTTPRPEITPSAAPRLSVLICTYNRQATLTKCLASFEDQDAQPGSYELVIVDDGCDDGSSEFLDQYPFRVPHRVVHRENGGLSAARNSGLEVARGEYVLIVNDDTMAHKGLVRAHLAAHDAEAGELRCVQGTFEQPEEVLQGAFMRSLEHSTLVFCFSQLEAGGLYDWKHFYTCNVSVPLAAVRQVGGFDESFRHYGAEDTELAFRLHQAGYRVRYDPRARADHDHVLDFDDLARRNVMTASAWVRLFQTQPGAMEDSAWSWVAELTSEGMQRSLVQVLPQLPILEQAARTLASVDLGALERLGPEGKVQSAAIVKQLEGILLVLNRYWWLEGFQRGLESFGLESFAELVPKAPVQLATAAKHRVLAWPRYEDDSDLEQLLQEYGETLCAAESACLCLRHDPSLDGSLDDAVTRLEQVYERILGDAELEVLFINDSMAANQGARLGEAVLASVELQPRDPARTRFLEQTGAVVVPEAKALALLLRGE